MHSVVKRSRACGSAVMDLHIISTHWIVLCVCLIWGLGKEKRGNLLVSPFFLICQNYGSNLVLQKLE